jgi:hypothetical protein
MGGVYAKFCHYDSVGKWKVDVRTVGISESVTSDDGFSQTFVLKAYGKFFAHFVAVATYAWSDGGMYFLWFGTHHCHDADCVAYNPAYCSFPSGMDGGNSVNVGGMEKDGHAVGCAHGESDVMTTGDEGICVGIALRRICDDSYVCRVCLTGCDDSQTTGWHHCILDSREYDSDGTLPDIQSDQKFRHLHCVHIVCFHIIHTKYRRLL